MYVIIVGGGKVGYYLAKDLIAKGHEVTIIEKDETKCQRITDELGGIVLEGECGPDLLEGAGASRADVLIAVTGEDETNLVISKIAKQCFHVPRVIARVVNPKNQRTFHRLGIDLTVSATDIIARLIEQEAILQEIFPLLPLKRGELEIVEIRVPPNSPVLKRTIQELPLPVESVLISIIRGDQIIFPRGEIPIRTNDTILALTATRRVEELKRVFHG